MRMERTHSQPAGHAAISDWAHAPGERGPNAESAKIVAAVAHSCFEFMTERVGDKGGGTVILLWGGEMPRPLTYGRYSRAIR